MKIPLITSIPIRSPSKSGDPQFVDNKHLSCVKSWIASGFRPISVNSINEVGDYRIPGVDIHIVDRDAYAETGKRLVYLEDMISAASAVSKGLVAITNADIELSVRPSSEPIMNKLDIGSGAVANRVDYSEGRSVIDRTYKSGFDLHIFHINDLMRIDLSGFIFGAPWWDHYLPIAMNLSGVRIYDAAHDFGLRHKRHSERWNMGVWCDLGRLHKDRLISILSKEEVSTPGFTAAKFCRNLTLHPIFLADLFSTDPRFLFNLWGTRGGLLNGCSLHCMSRENIRYLDSVIQRIG